MLGISDYWAFVAAVLVFLALCGFAGAAGERVRAHRRLSLLLQRAAGLALIGFGLKLAR